MQIHRFCIVIEIENKKYPMDYGKLIEMFNRGSDIENDKYEIDIMIRERTNKIININKTFQLLDVNTELKSFTSKNKKVIEYFLSAIYNVVTIKCVMIWWQRKKIIWNM
ncbi:MAG: hypothetical protein Ta2E_10940 [Mycoplasmoidaceae bacterium]|nr:MAG: hypothetical protein Ta2E_10940 [Mycoplasmoidaceae bacterium]